MAFGEVLTVFILFVVLPAVVFNGIAKLKATKASTASGGDGLRASELQDLIREAVEDAVGPLVHRIADLEERLGDETVDDLHARAGRIDPHLIDAPADDAGPAERRRERA